MSIFVNVGVRVLDGDRVPTKKELRELVREDPLALVFDQTSMFDENGRMLAKGQEPPDIRLDEFAVPASYGKVLAVCGPDPYDKRAWYATVKLKNGRWVVE